MINGSEQHTEKKLEKEVDVGWCVEEIVGSQVKLWISNNSMEPLQAVRGANKAMELCLIIQTMK